MLKSLFKSRTEPAAGVVASATEAVTTAEAEVAAAEAAYADNLTVAELPELERMAQRKLSAQVALDRARAVLEAATIRHTASVEADAEAARRERYDEAKALSETAEKKMRKEYGKHAIAIRELLLELAKATEAVTAANADLPAGSEQLAGPEASRSEPNLYAETLGEEKVDLWTPIDHVSPIPDDLQKTVQRFSGRTRGRFKDRMDSEENPLTYGVAQTDGGPIEVVRRRFRRTTVLPQDSGRRAEALATEIVLPALDAGATPFWTPTRYTADAIKQASSPLQPQPARPKRQPVFETSLVKQ